MNSTVPDFFSVSLEGNFAGFNTGRTGFSNGFSAVDYLSSWFIHDFSSQSHGSSNVLSSQDAEEEFIGLQVVEANALAEYSKMLCNLHYLIGIVLERHHIGVLR
ncbi:hypothetical protein QR680_016575 [Steinernema hermaphroditum]|uniref:Uncharacterized protein n=1 Tax=Steinernema hermaphroditum TaxID=289476 RepID=A0AA39HE35_9BILA|nr:hypothetical protein QR680_016575 [Steinernema hermaphroditum]